MTPPVHTLGGLSFHVSLQCLLRHVMDWKTEMTRRTRLDNTSITRLTWVRRCSWLVGWVGGGRLSSLLAIVVVAALSEPVGDAVGLRLNSLPSSPRFSSTKASSPTAGIGT